MIYNGIDFYRKHKNAITKPNPDFCYLFIEHEWIFLFKKKKKTMGVIGCPLCIGNCLQCNQSEINIYYRKIFVVKNEEEIRNSIFFKMSPKKLFTFRCPKIVAHAALK